MLVKELQGLVLDVRLERKEHVVTGAELFERLVKRELEQPTAPVGVGPSDDEGDQPAKGAKAKK